MQKRLLVTLLGVAAAMALPSSAVAATTFYVSNTGNDANSCTSPVLACQTIQAAVNKASPGDTIIVEPGVYPEPAPGPLTINKNSLTLLGAEAGVDARFPRGPESVVTDPQGTYVVADNVVLDGFTFQDSSNNVFTGYGVLLGAHTTGHQVLNNIVQNNIVGIGLGASNSLIEHNRIDGNDLPGSSSGTGIYTDQYVSGGNLTGDQVVENAFLGNNDAGIDVSNTDTSGGVFNLTISGNTFTSNGRAVLFFNTHNSTVYNNVVTNTTLTGSAAIRLFDNNTNLTIASNDLQTGVGHAIRSSVILGLGPSSGIHINENNIGTVGSASFVLDGLLVDPGSTSDTVNAECNWWGSPTGPTAASNPGGTGEEVVGDADFTPWLVAPAPGGACAGTVTPTPGKVTGGGQVDGDPLFSPLGDLVSLPAIVPSLSDPTAQATFGFIAKCCPGSGNLEYDDHKAGVRIKALSIDRLFISSPSPACPTTPGSKHAAFTGTASVIRSTGTTTESLTVKVDDCGEPGTQDTFAIKTDTYENGPNTLIGGNIQIH